MKITLTSYFDKVNRDIIRGEKKQRTQAAKHVRKELKKEINKKFGKGDLYKGVGMRNEKEKSLVGYKHPAEHAHLVEFGTDTRIVKNYRGEKGVNVNVGHMPADPTIVPVLQREAGEVERILSETWVD